MFAYSGRVPTTDCMVDMGVLGGRGPCQSQRKTVPKEPSPKDLMGVKERIEAVGKERLVNVRGKRDGAGERDELLCAFPYRTPVEVMLKAGIASAVKCSFGAGMVLVLGR